MRNNHIKQCIGLNKQTLIEFLCFGGLLASIANVFDHTKSISLCNQPCVTRRTLIDLNRDEYNQGLRYYPFTFDLEVVKLLMIYPVENAFQTKQKM